jgi:hypothetical protein
MALQTPVARQQIRNTQQWSNWEEVLDIATSRSNIGTVGRCFLWSPCRDYITRSRWDFERVLRQQWEEQEVGARRKPLWEKLVRQSPASKESEHGSWRSYGIGSRYQAKTGEDTADWEVFVSSVVNCTMCELAIALDKCAVNSITIPDTVYSHSFTRLYIQVNGHSSGTSSLGNCLHRHVTFYFSQRNTIIMR